MASWYDRMEDMRADDHHLQRLYDHVRARLGARCARARRRLRFVHVYPSRHCTYTVNKLRVFVRVRDGQGRAFPDCVLQYVLLHELAHVLNVQRGHGSAFQEILADLVRCGAATAAAPGSDWTCAEAVPADFNTCH